MRFALRSDQRAASKVLVAAKSYKDDVIDRFDGVIAYERKDRIATVYGLGLNAARIYKKGLTVGADGTVAVSAIDQAMCEVAEAFDASFAP